MDKAVSKDKKKATYEAYEKFERFKRSNEMSLADNTMEFEELLYCLEKYEIKIPPVGVAYRNLSTMQTLQKSKVPLLGPPYQTIPMTIW